VDRAASVLVGTTGQREGNHLAALELQKGWWRIIFRYGGQKYQRALDTQDRGEAQGQKARLEENLKLLKRGRLAYTPGDDLVTLLLSDGKLNVRPEVQKPVTLKQFFDEFKQGRPPGKEKNTAYTEDIHIKHGLRILGERTRIIEVPRKLQDYVNARAKEEGHRGKPVSQVTIKKELGTVSSVWNKWGLRKKLVPAPLSLVDLEYPKRKEKPPFMTWEQIERKIARGKLTEEEQEELWDALFLTMPEIEELLADVKTAKTRWKSSEFPWVYPMFVFAAHTGARRSEILRSRVEDIDFEAGELTIREKKKDRSEEETYRHVPMTPLLRAVMEEWLKAHPGGPYTFCKIAGETFTEQMANHYLRWTLDGGKWKVIRGWHTLRHSFVSNLASRGVSEAIMMKLAGHLNKETTRRYAHRVPSTVHDAIRLVFGGGAVVPEPR
jgi:integrase